MPAVSVGGWEEDGIDPLLGSALGFTGAGAALLLEAEICAWRNVNKSLAVGSERIWVAMVQTAAVPGPGPNWSHLESSRRPKYPEEHPFVARLARMLWLQCRLLRGK